MSEGQILNVAATRNQGIILGDDGLRYTFTVRDWGDNSVRAVPGMRVAYTAQDGFATDVRITQAAPNTASSQNASVDVTTPAHAAARSQPASTPSSGSILAPRGAAPGKKSHRFVTPTLEQKDKNVYALLLFLGVLGMAFAFYYIGSRERLVFMILAIVCVLVFPIYLLTWPFYVLGGIIWLLSSEERFDKFVHAQRYHTGLILRNNCLTGECN